MTICNKLTKCVGYMKLSLLNESKGLHITHIIHINIGNRVKSSELAGNHFLNTPILRTCLPTLLS